MPRVILRFKNKNLSHFNLGAEGPVTIGRRPTNTIVIDNLAISGVHAKIAAAETHFVVTDLNSKNGTFVNGRRVQEQRLQHKDVITIGKHHLVFDGRQPKVGGSAGAANGLSEELEINQHTMFMDTVKYHQTFQGKPETVTTESAAQLVRRTGAAGSWSLKGLTELRIGKIGSADIAVEGFFRFLAGNPAATIVKEKDGHYLNPVNGFLRTRLNGQRVKRPTLLAPDDLIQVGGLILQYRAEM
ncbi:MAG: FHA domain-containing protein [Desulfosarcinaceae bacterium]|nr:FHA domain-containing protein [Desulfosarcinaceae bacterium]